MTAVATSDPTENPDASEAQRPRRLVRVARWRTLALLAGIAAFAVVSAGCTPQQIAEASINKYFATPYQACASKIVARESNYKADALSPDGKNIGLFQINAVHTAWIKANYGYTFSQLTDPDKNAQVAEGLSQAALSYYGDRWQPWRLDGKPRTDGSCAA